MSNNQSNSANKPNILFIMADDWSPIAGCYGDDWIQTPNVDSAATRGTVFDNAFCTSPSCAVSRACILTGQHSHTHGQYGHCHGLNGFTTRPNTPSTPALLKQAGYTTACIGKKHVEPESVYPFDFDTFNFNSKVTDGRSPADFGQTTAEFLNSIGDKPFYCHVGIADPHRTYDNDTPHRGATEIPYDPAKIPVPDFLPDIPEVREDLAQYYQAISRFDQCVGAVIEALNQSGRADNTLIFITADHGLPFPGAKASSYETGHHCPLIVVDPTKKGGLRSQGLVDWTYFLPTIMDWCSLEAPDNLPGKSILPLLENPQASGFDEVYYSHNFHEVVGYYPYRVVRQRRYKYVVNITPELQQPLPSDLFRSPSWQAVLEKDLQQLGKRQRKDFYYQPNEKLYDLENDPMETTNLIEKPELQERVEQMREKLLQFRTQTRDPWLELSYQRGGKAAPKTDPKIA